MKTISQFTLVSLAGIYSKSFDQLVQQADSSLSSNVPSELRALTGASMGLLNNYGCWCHFEDNVGKGKGHPVDVLDRMCQQLHQGYECIEMDMDDLGSPCNPWTEPYVEVAGFNLSEQDVVIQCETNNPIGSCAAQACKVEGWFVQSYLAFVLQGGAIDGSKRHDNGFDMNIECPVSNGVKSDKQCCGVYPSRFTFKNYSGARECCGTATYNTLMFSCCSDLTIRAQCP